MRSFKLRGQAVLYGIRTNSDHVVNVVLGFVLLMSLPSKVCFVGAVANVSCEKPQRVENLTEE